MLVMYQLVQLSEVFPPTRANQPNTHSIQDCFERVHKILEVATADYCHAQEDRNMANL